MVSTKKSDISAISKRAILTKSIQFKEGELNIWNIRALVFSAYGMASLLGIYTLKEEKVGIDFTYWMCFYQAIGASLVVQKRFGIKKQILENVVGQGEMLGYGITTIKRANFKDCHFLFETNSSVAKEYKEKFAVSKQPICHHIRGLLAGTISFLTQKEVFCFEETCIAKGDKVCSFVVKETSAFKKISALQKLQIPLNKFEPSELGDNRLSKILDEKKSR